MNVSTILILAIATMAAATFATSRDCHHACRMDATGVAIAAVPQRTTLVLAFDTTMSTQNPASLAQ